MRTSEWRAAGPGSWHVICLSWLRIINRGNDMKATRVLIAGAAAVLLPFAGAMAQSSTPDQGAEPAQPAQQGATFESLDANGDGKISKAEAAANSNVSQQFSKYDQNGDGFIERAEVNSANTAPPKTPQ
jgi:hypothetical protein